MLNQEQTRQIVKEIFPYEEWWDYYETNESLEDYFPVIFAQYQPISDIKPIEWGFAMEQEDTTEEEFRAWCLKCKEEMLAKYKHNLEILGGVIDNYLKNNHLTRVTISNVGDLPF